MKVISLQSGSKGNCIYVETAGLRLLFDAGISGVKAQSRLAEFGRDIRDVDAVFVSHDHGDHIRSAGIFSRKFKHKLVVSEKTFACKKHMLGETQILRHFTPGEKIVMGATTITTVATPHDGVEPSVFIVESGGKRLGILTDLGHVFDGLPEIIGGLDAVMLESNYDPYMLENGIYPRSLQNRISGNGGHISNEQAAMLVKEHSGASLRWVCLSHISENNNTYDKALETHKQILREGRLAADLTFEIFVASQSKAVEMPEF